MQMVNGFVSRVALATSIIVSAAFTAQPASASIINWELVGVTFDDGGTATGTFSTDSSGDVTAFDITTTLGTSLPGFEYDSTTSYIDENLWNVNSFAALANDNSTYITLEFTNPLTSPSTDGLVLGELASLDELVGSWECANCGNVRDVTAGEAEVVSSTVTPLPPTWIMLLTGFAGVGFFYYRARKKNGGLAAA